MKSVFYHLIFELKAPNEKKLKEEKKTDAWPCVV